MDMTDIFKGGSMGTGLALGIGATFLLPATARIVGSIAKPLLKETIKGGLYVYDAGKYYAAGIGETFGDISAEARAEMKQGDQPTRQTKAKAEKSSS